MSDLVIGTITDNQSLIASAEGTSTGRFSIEGTWTGTIRFEASLDSGSDLWTDLVCIPYPQTNIDTTLNIIDLTTANGSWATLTSGYRFIRLRGVGVVGTAHVVLRTVSEASLNNGNALITRSIIYGIRDDGVFNAINISNDGHLRTYSTIVNTGANPITVDNITNPIHVIVDNAVAGKTLKSAAFNLTATGTVVPAVPGKKIKVFSYVKSFTNNVNSNFRSGASTALEGSIKGLNGSALSESVTPPGFLFATAVGQSLDLVVSTSGVNGRVSYWDDDAI
jgi:hypothetical protein